MHDLFVIACSKADRCGVEQGGYHIGDTPDDRTMDTLQKHDVHNYYHEARQVSCSALPCHNEPKLIRSIIRGAALQGRL